MIDETFRRGTCFIIYLYEIVSASFQKYVQFRAAKREKNTLHINGVSLVQYGDVMVIEGK